MEDYWPGFSCLCSVLSLILERVLIVASFLATQAYCAALHGRAMTLHLCLLCAVVSPQYKDIERWMYNGIGTTTYTLNSKGQMVVWSQEV